MVEYFALIDRVVCGLADRSPEARHAVYERAREALINELRKEPSTTEEDISRETAELREAVSRVEAKFSEEITAETAEQVSPQSSRSYAGPAGGKRISDRIPRPIRPALAGIGLLILLAAAVGTDFWRSRDSSALKTDLPSADADANVQVGESASDAVSVPPPVPLNDSTITDPGVTLAERAALLVDAPEEPQGIKVDTGNVIWSLERNSREDEAAPEEVKANIEIPKAKLEVAVSIRKNFETGLLASHTMELQFRFPSGDASSGPKQIDMPQMRSDDETPTGDPLAGVTVKAGEDDFLVGLARNMSEENTRLISERNWFDVPFLSKSNKRAKLTFEKGFAGERVWKDALSHWR